MAQNTVAGLERGKRELEAIIGNKDKNNAQLTAKLDDEQNLIAKAQKAMEVGGRAERKARAKAREIDQLSDELTARA